MTKKEFRTIKERIEDIEYYGNGFHKLNGRYVQVLNLRIKGEIVLVDIILGNHEENSVQRYNNCEYPFGELVK